MIAGRFSSRQWQISPSSRRDLSRSRRPQRYHANMPSQQPKPIYLDHNATTPVLPEVVEAMRECYATPYLNPASQHEFGRRARRST